MYYSTYDGFHGDCGCQPNESVDKKWIVKREQTNAKAYIKPLNHDFLEDLPRYICDIMYRIEDNWKSRDWFEEAWNKYRDHVLSGDKIKAPGFVFNDYIDKQIQEDFLSYEQSQILHSDQNITDAYVGTFKDVKISEIIKHSNPYHDKETGQFTNADDINAAIYGASDEELKAFNERKAQESRARAFIKKDIEANYVPTTGETAAKASQEILKGISDFTSDIAKQPVSQKGQIVRGKYPELTNEELQSRINRLSLEQRYSDIKGDTKYVKSGEEKTKEGLQKLSVISGILASLSIFIKPIIDKIASKSKEKMSEKAAEKAAEKVVDEFTKTGVKVGGSTSTIKLLTSL